MKRYSYFNTLPVNPMTIGAKQDKDMLDVKTGTTRSEVFSWVDFNKECMLGRTPDVLICGVSQLFEKNPKDFLSTVHSIINTHTKDKKVTLCVPAGNELEYEHLPKLQSLGFKGALPISAYYGVDESAKGISHFLYDREYWPEFVIDRLKNAKRIPTVVIFNSRIKTQSPLTLGAYRFFFKQRENNNCQIELASTWDELSSLLRTNPVAVAFHTDMIEDSAQEFVQTLESLVRFTHPKRRVNLAAIITKQTPLDLVKELQQTHTTGLVPGFRQWDESETLQGIMSAVNAIPHWPKHILKQLPGQSIKPKKHNIELSYRQQQILNLIQNSGISNKQIADKLKIKEGTVKLHVGVLLKKYAVQNRTQLANL